MKKPATLFAATIIIIACVAILLRLGTSSITDTPTDKIKHKPLVLAFLEADLVQGLAAISGELAGYVDVVSPHWVRFNTDGQLVTQHGSNMFVETAHQAGLVVWPLLAYAGPYGSKAGCPAVLCEVATAERFTQSIDDWVETMGVDGLVLDVENVDPVAREELVRLTAKLADKMHAKKRQLWVAIFPQVDFPTKLSDLHDVKALAAYADGVVLMAYDQHSPSTAPGPIGSYEWAERNVTAIAKNIDPNRMLLGVPAYGYRWQKQGNGWRTNVVSTKDMEARSQRGQLADDEQVWWESTEQSVAKTTLVVDFGLRGVAVWRQGLANPALWPALRAALGDKKR